MNIQEKLEKYKDKRNQEAQLRLKDGGIVVGYEVDEENRLWYAIEKEGAVTLERANRQDVVELLRRDKGSTINVPIKRRVESEEEKLKREKPV